MVSLNPKAPADVPRQTTIAHTQSFGIIDIKSMA
jgi:hypothetical protein